VLGFVDARKVGADAPSLLTQKADLVIGQPDLQHALPNYSPSNHLWSDAHTPNNAGFYAAGTGNDPVALAPGMLALLGRYGSNFSLAAASTQAPPGPTNGLNDVEVVVNGVPAPIFRLDQAVVYFQVPYAALTREPRISWSFVLYGQILAAANFAMQSATPGIYTSNQQGTGQAAATNADGSVNSSGNAVKAGDIITLWLTGAGFIPNVADGAAPGAAIPTPIPPKVFIGLQAATNIQYSGVSPNTPACGRSTYRRRQLCLPDLLPSSSR